MFQWVESTIEWFYENFCYSHRRSRKCYYCSRFLPILPENYHTIRDNKMEIDFCSQRCSIDWIESFNRNRPSFDEYKKTRAKSEEWFFD